MTFDPATEHLLAHQARRMAAATTEAERRQIRQLVEEIIDRAPKPIGTAADGEVVYSDASPMVRGQIAVNNSGVAERVLPLPEFVLPADAMRDRLQKNKPTRQQPQELTRTEEFTVKRWAHVLNSLPTSQEPPR